MVRMLRSASAASDYGENSIDSEDILKEDCIETTRKGQPRSDDSYARRFVISKKDSLAGCSLYKIRHPKNASPVIYRISEKYCEEVLTVGDDYNSLFYGESVVEDGLIRLFSPIHPIFLVMPYFIKNKTKWMELSEILSDDEFPAIAALLTNKQLIENLDKIADVKDVCDTMVYRFNEQTALEWVRTRFERLKAALLAEGSLHKTISENVEVLDRYTFAVLCDFLCPDILTQSKEFLKIQDAPVEEHRVDMGMKRKAADDDEYIVEKPAAKQKSKESVVQKKLQQASKGSKSISSFFSNKAKV